MRGIIIIILYVYMLLLDLVWGFSYIFTCTVSIIRDYDDVDGGDQRIRKRDRDVKRIR